MWDRNMDGKVCSAELISVFLHIFTLSWSVPKVSSYHSKSITLDKYTFELGYDDEFDMGEIAQMTTKEIAHFRRVCPGRREWRRDARVEAEVGPQAHRQLFHCPGKKVIFVQLCSKSERKLLCSCTSHLASLSSRPTSLSSCRPPVSSPGVEFQWGLLCLPFFFLVMPLPRWWCCSPSSQWTTARGPTSPSSAMPPWPTSGLRSTLLSPDGDN